MKRNYLSQIILACALVIGLSITSLVWADDNDQLKQQVADLQAKVNQLETQLANKQPPLPPPPSAMPLNTYAYESQLDDPFAQMIRINQQMENNMRQAMGAATFNPRVDMTQNDKNYIITMDVPGMDKNKIDVQIKEGMLVISGERKSETDNQGNQYYRQERSFGTFMQAIPLPEDAKTDQIKAKYNNGVLTVSVGRKEKEPKKQQDQRIIIE